MNAEINYRELAELVFKAMNSCDFDTFETVITEDVVFDFPGAGRAEGDRRSLLLMRSIIRKFPKLHFDVTETIVEGNRACVIWTNEGEDLQGNSYSNSGATFIHFSADKICFLSDYFKDTSFIQSS